MHTSPSQAKSTKNKRERERERVCVCLFMCVCAHRTPPKIHLARWTRQAQRGACNPQKKHKPLISRGSQECAGHVKYTKRRGYVRGSATKRKKNARLLFVVSLTSFFARVDHGFFPKSSRYPMLLPLPTVLACQQEGDADTPLKYLAPNKGLAICACKRHLTMVGMAERAIQFTPLSFALAGAGSPALHPKLIS